MALAEVCSYGHLKQIGKPCARCAPHAAARPRKIEEPWRRVYDTKAWQRCRRSAIARDGGRCRVIELGARCMETSRLHAHHHPASLEELYRDVLEDGGTWVEFVAVATDPSVVIMTCAAHNNALDALRRRKTNV